MQNSFSNFVPFGSAMPKVGISKFSAKVGDTRIRVLSVAEGDFLLAKTHYLKGVGSFHCFGGSCCQAVANAPEGEANSAERAILPIAVATPSVTGGVSVEYMYLALPETKYSQLVSLNQNVGDITSYDILVQCTDENYQKYTFLPLVGQPSVIITEAESPKIQSFLVNYRSNIMKTLGKTLDENSFAVARAKSLQQAANSVGVSFTPNPAASQVFAQPVATPALPVATPAVVPPVVATEPQPQVVEVVVPATPSPTVATPVVAAPTQEVVVEATSVEQAPPQAVTTPTTEVPSGTADIDWSAFMNSGN